MRFTDLGDNWHKLAFCFTIVLDNGKIVNLTSSDHFIKNGHTIFLPNSGLRIIKAKFNESAQDQIILNGIFEDDGICELDDLLSSVITIHLYQDNNLQNLFTFNCTNYVKQALRFELVLESKIKKYNQSILLSYSKTCRANFGDTKCKLDIELYSGEYTVGDVYGREVLINNIDKENGYFDTGSAFSLTNSFCSKIISQINGKIELYKMPQNALKAGDKIKLSKGCDKSFTTCCIKFNNAVNFRGEPNIPEANFIKIY